MTTVSALQGMPGVGNDDASTSGNPGPTSSDGSESAIFAGILAALSTQGPPPAPEANVAPDAGTPAAATTAEVTGVATATVADATTAANAATNTTTIGDTTTSADAATTADAIGDATTAADAATIGDATIAVPDVATSGSAAAAPALSVARGATRSTGPGQAPVPASVSEPTGTEQAPTVSVSGVPVSGPAQQGEGAVAELGILACQAGLLAAGGQVVTATGTVAAGNSSASGASGGTAAGPPQAGFTTGAPSATASALAQQSASTGASSLSITQASNPTATAALPLAPQPSGVGAQTASPVRPQSSTAGSSVDAEGPVAVPGRAAADVEPQAAPTVPPATAATGATAAPVGETPPAGASSAPAALAGAVPATTSSAPAAPAGAAPTTTASVTAVPAGTAPDSASASASALTAGAIGATGTGSPTRTTGGSAPTPANGRSGVATSPSGARTARATSAPSGTLTGAPGALTGPSDGPFARPADRDAESNDGPAGDDEANEGGDARSNSTALPHAAPGELGTTVQHDGGGGSATAVTTTSGLSAPPSPPPSSVTATASTTGRASAVGQGDTFAASASGRVEVGSTTSAAPSVGTAVNGPAAISSASALPPAALAPSTTAVTPPPAASAARAPAAPDEPQTPLNDQLSTVLLPAARQADGSYQVNIRLQPEDLGVVHVELHLDAGTVSVSLHADGDATRDMLRQNLPQLRQQLADSGLTTGQFDVGNGPGTEREGTSSQVPNGGPAQDPEQTGGSHATAVARTPAQAVSSSSSSQLDMRL